MKVLVLSNMAQSLVNFRGPLLAELVAAGHDVVAVAPERDDPRVPVLAGMGVRYVPVPMTRAGIDPWRDLAYVVSLIRLIRAERPDAVFAYTIKPVVYGMVAAWLTRVRSRSALVNGLGYAFGRGSTKQRLVGIFAMVLYRAACACATSVIFQNPDDRQEFLDRRLVAPAKTTVVAGSGIDLERFPPAPPVLDGPVYLLIARMIREKGIAEFVEAARAVRARHPGARFQLLGPYDRAPGAIDPETMAAWERTGLVTYLGTTDDVRPVLAGASVYVLPSYYREGVPRTNLEALATGRPVVTTDAPGCRETVRDGVNGFLVPPRDAPALAAAMLRFADDRGLIARMGAASRTFAVETFDVRRVNAQMRRAMGLGGAT